MLAPGTRVMATTRFWGYAHSARIAQHLAPSICLLAGVGVVGAARLVLGARRVAPAVRVWIVAMALFAIGGIVRDVRKPHKHPSDDEARRVMAEIGSTASSSDVSMS